MFKIFVAIVFLIILGALGTALYHLVSKKGSSDKLLKALIWRISLSLALIILLVAAYNLGWIQPKDPYAKNRIKAETLEKDQPRRTF